MPLHNASMRPRKAAVASEGTALVWCKVPGSTGSASGEGLNVGDDRDAGTNEEGEDAGIAVGDGGAAAWLLPRPQDARVSETTRTAPAASELERRRGVFTAHFAGRFPAIGRA
jgi:hypothetical protein